MQSVQTQQKNKSFKQHGKFMFVFYHYYYFGFIFFVVSFQTLKYTKKNSQAFQPRPCPATPYRTIRPQTAPSMRSHGRMQSAYVQMQLKWLQEKQQQTQTPIQTQIQTHGGMPFKEFVVRRRKHNKAPTMKQLCSTEFAQNVIQKKLNLNTKNKTRPKTAHLTRNTFTTNIERLANVFFFFSKIHFTFF